MRQIFENGSNHDDRSIMIEIDEDAISFYFYEQYLRQENWIEMEKERRELSGEEEMDEDDMRNNEFYWIDKEQWIKNVNNWHSHMEEKNWFTKEMSEWMDENCKIK